MRAWTKLLPFFIVEWIAKKHCMKQRAYGINDESIFVQPYGPGNTDNPQAIVLIEINPVERVIRREVKEADKKRLDSIQELKEKVTSKSNKTPHNLDPPQVGD